MFKWEFSKYVSVMTEANFTLRGSEYQSIHDSYPMKNRFIREYLEILTYFSLNFTNSDTQFRPIVYTGGSYSYLLKKASQDMLEGVLLRSA